MEKILFLHNDRDHKSVVPLQFEVSVCVQPQGACITGVPAVSANTKLPVLSQTKQKKPKKQQRSRHLPSGSSIPRYSELPVALP